MTIELMQVLKFITSFLIKQITPEDSVKESLEKCYYKAIDEWDIDSGTKDLARKSMDNNLDGLKDFLLNKKKFYNPKRKELLKLWTDEVRNNPVCINYINSVKIDQITDTVENGLVSIQQIIDAFNNAEVIKEIQEKVNSLASRGVIPIETYWKKWSTGKNVSLNYDIVLSGRKNESESVNEACKTQTLLYVESTSREDAIAFVVATILNDYPEYTERAVVVDNVDAYNELIKNKLPYIIITSILENHNFSVSEGHSVIVCVVPEDRIRTKIKLSEVNRDGFVKSLKQLGFTDAKAQRLRKDSQHDTSALRRLLGIKTGKPLWDTPDNEKIITPIILVGSWNRDCNGDKELVSKIAGVDYGTIERTLCSIAMCDETPILQLGNIWKLRFPKLLVTDFADLISQDHIDRIKVCLDWIMEDDDPDAIAKHDSKGLNYRKNKQVYSGEIKMGLLQTITLLSIAYEEKNENTYWIHDYISQKLKDFDFKRYLSNQHNIKWMAEASPSAFLGFLEDNVKKSPNVLDDIFKVQEKPSGIFGNEIYYTDLLFGLENISWNEDYLSRTTVLLLRFSDYKNDSNFSNKPINTLSNIYNLVFPQTNATGTQRFTILQALSIAYRQPVSLLCFKILQNIKQSVFMPNSSFQWRYADYIDFLDRFNYPTTAEIIDYTKLLLETTDLTTDSICSLIELSSNDYMGCARDLILDNVMSKYDLIKDNQQVIDCLRKDINQHVRCKNAAWAISGDELDKYKQLLHSIEPSDIVSRNAHYFDDYCVIYDSDFLDNDYEVRMIKSNQRRSEVLAFIINERGLEAVWALSKKAKLPHSVADAFISLTNYSHCKDVFELYCNGTLTHDFARSYFSKLYYKNGVEKYIKLIDTLNTRNHFKIALLYYSPEFNGAISQLVYKQDQDIQTEYWKNVFIWRTPENNNILVIDNLLKVGRFDDIIEMMARGCNISSEQKLAVLFKIFEHSFQALARKSYEVAHILETVDMPQDERTISDLFFFELILFKCLEPYFNNKKFHIMTIVNSDPKYLIEIIKMMYLEDSVSIQDMELSEDEKQELTNKFLLALDFFHHYHEVPGMKDDKTIDEQFLEQYIDDLIKLANECNRTKAIPTIIGKIIGNIPETEDYPTDFMCRLVEKLSDDHIDNEIGYCISNRRSFSTRSPFEGGTVEQHHIATLKKYRERAKLKSPRLVKIFDNEIRGYMQMGKSEDKQAKLNDMDY